MKNYKEIPIDMKVVRNPTFKGSYAELYNNGYHVAGVEIEWECGDIEAFHRLLKEYLGVES